MHKVLVILALLGPACGFVTPRCSCMTPSTGMTHRIASARKSASDVDAPQWALIFDCDGVILEVRPRENRTINSS